jgi:hypothetical protein
MATFILVHGAFDGGWCWREVSLRLGRATLSTFSDWSRW